MIRPIDSSYSATHTSTSPDSQFTLLPSPFPPYPMHTQHSYSHPPSLPLPPIPSELNVVHHEYYHSTPPSSESSSTSPSSMSSRSIETLDSPVGLQSQQSPHIRYQPQHHHSEPYIYTGYTSDELFHMSRGSAPFQNQYVSQSTPYAPFVVPLGPEIYGASHAGKPPPTIESINSTIIASSGSSARRKHRMSFSTVGSGELEFFPHGTRMPRGTQRAKPTSRMNAVSPYRRGAGAQRASAGPAPSVPLQLVQGHDSASFLMLEMSSSALPLSSNTPTGRMPVLPSSRTFPNNVQVDPQFSLFYRKFYVPSYFAPNDPLGKFVFAEK